MMRTEKTSFKNVHDLGITPRCVHCVMGMILGMTMVAIAENIDIQGALEENIDIQGDIVDS